MNQLMQQVQQMLQQGAKPEQVVQQIITMVHQGQVDPNEAMQVLVQLGVPQEQVAQMLQGGDNETQEGAASNPQEEQVEGQQQPQESQVPQEGNPQEEQMMAAGGYVRDLIKKALGGVAQKLDKQSVDYVHDLNNGFLTDVKNSFLKRTADDVKFQAPIPGQPVMAGGGELPRYDDAGQTKFYKDVKQLDPSKQYGYNQTEGAYYELPTDKPKTFNPNQMPFNAQQHPLAGLIAGFFGNRIANAGKPSFEVDSNMPDEVTQAILQGKTYGKTADGKEWSVSGVENKTKQGLFNNKGESTFNINWGPQGQQQMPSNSTNNNSIPAQTNITPSANYLFQQERPSNPTMDYMHSQLQTKGNPFETFQMNGPLVQQRYGGETMPIFANAGDTSFSPVDTGEEFNGGPDEKKWEPSHEDMLSIIETKKEIPLFNKDGSSMTGNDITKIINDENAKNKLDKQNQKQQKINKRQMIADAMMGTAQKTQQFFDSINNYNPARERAVLDTTNLFLPQQNQNADRGQYDQWGSFRPNKQGNDIFNPTDTNFNLQNQIFAFGGGVELGQSIDLTDEEHEILKANGFKLKKL